ncbi:MAG: hypothetical protein LBP50_09815, partial [Tannerella sp.]|nr:hypothetical protein [Tannerella sp.]
MAQADYRRLNRELAERIARYAAAIRSTFYRLSNELVRLALKVAGGVDAEAPFRFDAYPELSKEAERVFTRLRQEVYDTIINAQEAERTMADIDAGTIAVATLGEKAAKSNPKYNPLFVAAPVMTLQALREFTRTVGPPQSATPSSGASPPSLPPKAPGGTSLPGNIVPRRFDLSGRVWNLTGNFRNEIQQLIDGGIRDGLSADSLSRRVQKYLNEPDRLFRRVRDADGKLTLSKAAEGYHPGRGVYRSSYKNAMRLARTEINMAYHEQAHERWRQLDFIAGFRVVLSNAHPVYDICDELQGEYPKDFKFTGWHPQCMCHTIALIKGED